MKRLVSLLVMVAMLAGMCVTAGASDAPTYKTYSYSGNINTTVAGITNRMPAYDEIVEIADFASNPNGRYGDSVYRITQSAFDAYNKNCDSIISLSDVSRVYTEGEKVHITTELMIPTGGMNMRTDYCDSKLGIGITPKMGADAASATAQAQGIRVANRGNKHATKPLFLAAFDGRYQETSRRFSILGGILSSEEWEFDKWYRFDVVLTMGANPKASIYVNGEPLTVDPDHGNGTTASYNDNDATFDGVNVTSENLDIGTWVLGEDNNYTFEKMGLWGFTVVNLFQTHVTQAENLTHVVYMDDMIYRELPPSAIADIPDALTLEGMKDGGAFKATDLANAKVNVPAFIEHKTASVELAIDGVAIAEKQDVPLTYDLSTLSFGVHQVVLTAKDAEGNVIDTANMSFNLPPADDIRGMGVQTYGDTANTDKFWWVNGGEGYYYGTTKKDLWTEGYQMYTTTGGPKGENDYFVKLDKDETASWLAEDGETTVNASTGPLVFGYRVNHNYGAQPEGDRKNWKDGIVRVNYDIYAQFEGADWTGGWNVKPLQIGIGRKDVVPMTISGSEVRTQYYFGNGALGNGMNLDRVTDRWVHHEWVLDYYNKTVQFLRDGVAVNGADGTPYFPMYKEDGSEWALAKGFEGVWFTWDANKGWLGVDNLDVSYELAVPYVKAVNFGEGNAIGNKVLSTATAAAVEIPGMIFSADGTATMANYVSLVDDEENAVEGVTAAMAADGKTVNITIPAGTLTVGEEYQIKLAAGVPYGREGHTMTGNDPAVGDPSDPDNYKPAEYTVLTTDSSSIYTFTAVESLDDGVDDGVEDDITVTGARFTKHGTRIDLNPVVGVNGSNLSAEDKLRAELKVSNALAVAKTCSIVTATYSGDKLVDIAISTVRVPAYAKDAIITSAPIVVDETAITAKAFLVNDIGTLAPLSYAYDILGNVVQ